MDKGKLHVMGGGAYRKLQGKKNDLRDAQAFQAHLGLLHTCNPIVQEVACKVSTRCVMVEAGWNPPQAKVTNRDKKAAGWRKKHGLCNLILDILVMIVLSP